MFSSVRFIGKCIFPLGLISACAASAPDYERGGGSGGGDTGGGASLTGGSGGSGATGGASASGGSTSTGGAVSTGGSGTGGASTTGGTAGNPAPSSGCGKAPVIAPSQTDNPGWPYVDDERTRLTVSGKLREFSVYIPPNYDQTKEHTLYFTYHGCGGGKSPSGYIDASQGNGIIIAPQGLVGSCGGGTTGWNRSKGSEDFEFFDAMVDWATSGFCIDENKVFAGGHSHGGYFSAALGCWRGDVLRGVAPQSAGPVTMTDCTGQVATYFIHHVEDLSVLISEGEALREQYRSANHCGTTTNPTSPSPCVQYDGCDGGFPLGWCPLTGTIIWEYTGDEVSPHNAPWAWAPAASSTWAFFATLGPK